MSESKLATRIFVGGVIGWLYAPVIGPLFTVPWAVVAPQNFEKKMLLSKNEADEVQTVLSDFTP